MILQAMYLLNDFFVQRKGFLLLHLTYLPIDGATAIVQGLQSRLETSELLWASHHGSGSGCFWVDLKWSYVKAENILLVAIHQGSL